MLIRGRIGLPIMLIVSNNFSSCKGYSIFKSALGGPELFWGYLPPQFHFVSPPPLPAHFKFNITLRNTLCHPLLPHFDLFSTPYPRITNSFQFPRPGNLWKWNSPNVCFIFSMEFYLLQNKTGENWKCERSKQKYSFYIFKTETWGLVLTWGCLFSLQGDEVVLYLQTDYLPSLNTPPLVAQEFCQAVKSDSKTFRNYFKVSLTDTYTCIYIFTVHQNNLALSIDYFTTVRVG